MKPIIRECFIDDSFAIQQLNFLELGYDFPVEQTQQKLRELLASKKDKIFVAEVDGIIVGYVHANDYELLYAPPMKNIMGIAVLTEYRRKGIGKALLEKVERWAKETGAAGVRLVSGGSRIDAHSFYNSLGYGEGKPQLNFKKQL